MKLFVALVSALLLLEQVAHAFQQPRFQLAQRLLTIRNEQSQLYSDPVDDVAVGDGAVSGVEVNAGEIVAAEVTAADQIDASIESIVADLPDAAVLDAPVAVVAAAAPSRPNNKDNLKLAALEPAYPDGTSYIMCSSCKAAFLMTEEGLKKRSLRVRCCVCDKTWFQTSERLLKTDGMHHLQNMTQEKIDEVRGSMNERQWVKTKGIGIFVGNLPYTYEEKEIGDIFGEYGLIGISLVRDNEGQSKGFAFLEVSNQADADLMITEMHQFYTDGQRRLTVRMVSHCSFFMWWLLSYSLFCVRWYVAVVGGRDGAIVSPFKCLIHLFSSALFRTDTTRRCCCWWWWRWQGRGRWTR